MIVFTTPAISWMKYIGGGWVGGGEEGIGGGWEAKGRLYHPQEDKLQCCVFSRAQKQLQSTWQAEMVVSSSLTHQAC